jgi:FkbM family methyltransferase
LLILSEKPGSIVRRQLKRILAKMLKYNSNENLLIPFNDFVFLDQYTNGVWEPEIVHLILNQAEAGYDSFLLDVGANVGITSYHTGDSFKRVFLFEPVPILLACAQYNLRSVKNCEFIEAAVGATSGESYFYVDEDNTGSSSHEASGENAREQTVNFVNGQDIVQIVSERVPKRGKGVVKIDVEGMEVDVFNEILKLRATHDFVVLSEVASLENYRKLIAAAILAKKDCGLTVHWMEYSARRNSLAKFLSLFKGRTVRLSEINDENKILFPAEILFKFSTKETQ